MDGLVDGPLAWLIAWSYVRSWSAIPLTSAGLLLVAGSCVLPWDTYDPRIGDETSGGGADGVGGTSTSVGPGSGGAATGGTSSVGGEASGGQGASDGGGGSGGASGECAGARDGTLCGSAADNDCDAPDTCSAGLCVSNQAADATSCDDCTGGFCGGCASGVCQDCSEVPETLPTVFTSSASADGLMFNVEALEKLQITGFSLNLETGFSGEIEVYVNPGGHLGEEENPSAWTQVFQTDVTSAGSDTATFMSLNGNTIEIDAGETLGLYITTIATMNNDQRYLTEGTTAGTPAVSNSSLSIKYGRRLDYPFTLLSTIKLWNGIVHYELCQ